jgi:large subunit ribosomal protein L13
MIVIDAKDSILGRVASFVAKQALKGEEVTVVNCNKIIVSGKKASIKMEFEEKRARHGSSQKGPIQNKASCEKITKRAIRGMLPDHREGRGRVAFKKIKCYNEVPKEFEQSEKIVVANKLTPKYSYLKEFTRK